MHAKPLALLLLSTALLTSGCTQGPTDAADITERPSWLTDSRWKVIHAQDHRDTRTLLTLLADSSSATRAQAALALASVGESSAAPSLLRALSDADPTVRANAAFAFGFCGDSVNVHELIERFSPEENPAVRGRIAEAAGRCGRRAGADLLLRRTLSSKADSLGVLRGLYFATTTNSTDTSHVRYALSLYTANDPELDEAALHVSARSKPDLVMPFVKRLLEIAMTIPDSGYTDLRLPLLGALGKTGDKDAMIRLQEALENDMDPRMRVMALRGLGRFERKDTEKPIWAALNDSVSMVRDQALEQVLAWKEPLDGTTAWTTAQEHSDYRIKIPLYGLVMKYGDEDTRNTCGMLLKSMAQQDLGPYLNAELVNALWYDSDTARTIMQHGSSAVVRQAAMTMWLAHFDASLRNKEVSKPMRDRTMSMFLRDALLSGDAGIVASACERFADEPKEVLHDALDEGTIRSLRTMLHPIRDLETLQLLDAAIARRDGKPAPPHRSPPFNHPIDKARLSSLKQEQRYRIATNQGDVVIAVESVAAPGSCAAFDSLVTAGYYNGKYFHRVVSDFVAQGGCSRGDGYGAMDWTLRTELGRDGFTTGAVGLASAGKDTESCQFFFMLADAPHLDGRYTRFAHVESGMAVVWRLRVGDVIQRVERLP